MKTGKLCSRCEALPSKITGEGKLYLWFPLGHSFNKVINHFLRHAGERCRIVGDRQCVLTATSIDEVIDYTKLASDLLTGEEIKDTRALFVNGEDEPQFEDFSRLTSLRQFAAMAQSGWLLEMLSAERVTSLFQPIVHAGDTTRVFAQEALLRGLNEDGSLIPPGRIFDLCRDADLLFQLDLLARRTAVREAGRHGIKSHVFINFNPTAIYDPTFCLRSTVRAIDEAGIKPGNIVFEVTESDRSADENHLRRILDYYRDAGFSVALDDLGSGYSSLNLVHQLRPDYIKLDMQLIRDVHKDQCKATIAEKILEIAQRLSIKTVAEGVETAEELDWVQRHGADFVQGYFIAKPSAVPLTTPAMQAARADASAAHDGNAVAAHGWTSILHEAVASANTHLEDRPTVANN